MKNVKMSNAEIVSFRKILKNVVEKNLGKTIKFQYAILNNLRKIFNGKADLIEELKEQKIRCIEEEKYQISLKYGQKDETGKLIVKSENGQSFVPIDPEKKEEFNKEYSELITKFEPVYIELNRFMETIEEFEVYDMDVNDCDGIDLKTMDEIYLLLKE